MLHDTSIFTVRIHVTKVDEDHIYFLSFVTDRQTNLELLVIQLMASKTDSLSAVASDTHQRLITYALQHIGYGTMQTVFICFPSYTKHLL